MKYKSFFYLSIFLLLCYHKSFTQEIATISKADIMLLMGSWQGSLTYLDYTSNKPYSMSANLEVKQIGSSNKFLFVNLYPNESGANSVDTITVSENGRLLNNDTIVSNKKLKNGVLEIITNTIGIDGNESAAANIRYTYLISKKEYINRKDVMFVGQKEWIKRHEYNYKK